MRRLLTLLISAVALTGCSIYPLPEDGIGVNSERIAVIVRCQARAAIRGEILRNIEAFDFQNPGALAYETKTGGELIVELSSNPARFRKLDWAKFAKQLREPFMFYKNALISYDFTVDTTETNNTGIDLTLLGPVSRGTGSLGLVAKNDRTREVKRHFRVFDTFDSLARLTPEAFCRHQPNDPNPIYPSAGLIRVDSLIRQFVQQNQNGNLANLADKAEFDLPQISDTITFTTKFTGNIGPTFEFNPAANTFAPSRLAANADNSRQDLHTIIILVQLPPKDSPLPRFDELGRITAVSAARLDATVGLDRQRDRNAQDAIIQLGSGVSRLIQ